jgi:cobaltochelatase CobS
MSNVASAPAWQSYQVGTVVTVADGREFRITNIETRRTSGGYSSRLFTLEGPNGEVVVKTSRALTLWTQGKGSDEPSDLEAEATGSSKDLAALLAEAVSPYVTAAASDTHGVDKAEVAKIVDERLAALVPQRIEVVQLDGTVNPVGVQHTHFDALLRIVACRLCAWLVGPAGSGKTSAAKSVADALTLPFYATSVGPQTSQSQLLGYYDANGAYVTTQLRQAYEHGGVFLLDEVDAGSAAVLVVINALLANGHAAFPDRVVERHPDFVLLAGANTIGQGADRQYVGRQQADAATLDRFVALPWDYDPQIEAAACGVPFDVFSDAPKPKGRNFLSTADRENVEERCAEYCRKVVSIRNAVEGLGKGVRFLCGPRASIHGCKLIRAGFSVKDTLDCCVWKGCDEDTKKKIEARC